jgi:acyl dehydratase
MPLTVVGSTVRTASFALNPSDAIAFALQFDPQPMHTDEVAAKATFFGRLVASGWYVAAVTMKLMVTSRPFETAPIIGAEIENIRFRRPISCDATLYCVAELIGVEPSRIPGYDYGRVVVETRDVTSDEVLASQRWKVLLPICPADPNSKTC